jgi:hypothetical protein
MAAPAAAIPIRTDEISGLSSQEAILLASV